MPWPISERAMRITTVSSGLDHHPGVDLRRAVGGRARRRPNGMRKPSDKPAADGGDRAEERAAVELRSIAHGHAASLTPLRGGVDRLAHLLIGAAAADVGDRRVDVGVGRLRVRPSAAPRPP